MSIFDYDHTDTAPVTTPVREVGMGEAFNQMLEQQFKVDSQLALPTEIRNRYKETVSEVERRTGQKIDWYITNQDVVRYAEILQGEAPKGWDPNNGFTGEFLSLEQQRLNKLKKLDDSVKALNDPGVRSLETVLQEVYAMQRQVEQETAEVSQGSGTMASIAGFVGSMVGSFSSRDPVNLLTLPIGGFGRSIAMRIGTEMGVAAAITGATETLEVLPNRELAGLPERSPVPDILFAAGGAGVLRGLGEGVGVLRQRSAARAANSDSAFDLNDEQLASMFRAAEESPRARAALDLIEAQRQFEAVNPHGKSDLGTLRFTAELEDVARVVNGTDTAVARVLPDLPFESRLLDEDVALVRAEQPDMYAGFEAAERRVQELDEQIAEAEVGIEDIRLSDAVARIDEDSGALVRSLEDDLAQPALTAERKADIERRLTQVVESLGTENVARQLNDVAIKPRKNLQALRKSRKAAASRFREARKQVDAEVRAIRQRRTVRELMEQRKNAPLAATEAARAPLLPLLRHDVVTEAAAMSARAAELAPEEALRVARVTPDENGMVDIGLEEPVPADFEIMLEMPDGSSQRMTVQQVLDDLGEDVDLEDAMRNCAL